MKSFEWIHFYFIAKSNECYFARAEHLNPHCLEHYELLSSDSVIHNGNFHEIILQVKRSKIWKFKNLFGKFIINNKLLLRLANHFFYNHCYFLVSNQLWDSRPIKLGILLFWHLTCTIIKRLTKYFQTSFKRKQHHWNIMTDCGITESKNGW